MISRLVGLLFAVIGRVKGGDAGRDLERVGQELRSLERRRAHRPTSER
ncbi:MAG TPA: hypothetical protein VLX64_06165 [Thermoplasmata archaeon]|nr:hypothetical protein [Thermoplasmata archaeon]